MYGGYVIKNPDNRLAREQHKECFLGLMPKAMLFSLFMLIFFELLALSLIGYAVYLRFRHFLRIQSEVEGMSWQHALDFAWLVMFTNVLRDM